MMLRGSISRQTTAEPERRDVAFNGLGFPVSAAYTPRLNRPKGAAQCNKAVQT
jgi:hypothetical protein